MININLFQFYFKFKKKLISKNSIYYELFIL